MSADYMSHSCTTTCFWGGAFFEIKLNSNQKVEICTRVNLSAKTQHESYVQDHLEKFSSCSASRHRRWFLFLFYIFKWTSGCQLFFPAELTDKINTKRVCRRVWLCYTCTREKIDNINYCLDETRTPPSLSLFLSSSIICKLNWLKTNRKRKNPIG
jgi:hypothetical protein